MRGPYCDWLDEKRKEFRAQMHALYVIVGGNPRHWVIMQNKLQSRMGAAWMLELLSDKPCPCAETPDPQLYHKFFRCLLTAKLAPSLPEPKVWEHIEMIAQNLLKESTNEAKV